MPLARSLVVGLALVAALPCGWVAGVLAAKLLRGPEVGVFPVLSIPVGLLGATAFALAPRLHPALRLTVLVAATALFIVLA